MSWAKDPRVDDYIHHRTLLFTGLLSAWILVLSFPWSRYLRQPSLATSKDPHSWTRRCRLGLFYLFSSTFPFWPYWSLLQLLAICGYLAILSAICSVHYDSDREYDLYGFLAVAHMLISSLLPLRRSILDLFFGISFNQLLFLHRWIGTGAVVMTFVHVGMYLNKWVKDGLTAESYFRDLSKWPGSMEGFLAGVVMAVIFLTSLPPVRRHFYAFFKWIHCLCIPTVIGLLVIHAPKTWPFFIALVTFYGADLVLRYTSLLQPVSITQVHRRQGLVKIHLDQRKFRMAGTVLTGKSRPGQFYYLYAPKASLVTSHPFSLVSPTLAERLRKRAIGNSAVTGLLSESDVTRDSTSKDLESQSSLTDPDLIFAIREYGHFSHKVYDSIHTAEDHHHHETLVRLEGPYGRCFEGVGNAGMILFVGGGVGVAPMFSLLETVVLPPIDDHEDGFWTPPNVEFLWVVKSLTHVEWFIEEVRWLAAHDIRTRIFITGAEDQPWEHPVSSSASPSSDMKKSVIPTENVTSFLESAASITVTKGRPDFLYLFKDIKQLRPYDHVSVAACGPSSLVRSLRHACVGVSDTRGFFSLFTEEFEF